MRGRVVIIGLAGAVVLAAAGACSSSDAVTASSGDAGEDHEAVTPSGSSETTFDASLPALEGGAGAAKLDGGDPPSHGGTITFESIGKAGSYPSTRDPAVGTGCDVYKTDSCCLATKTITSDALTPWDEDLIMTLRGPMEVATIAVYQPSTAGAWGLVSSWTPSDARGIAFDGNNTEKSGFPGTVGTECLVNVSTSQLFPCGTGSSPFCPPAGKGHQDYAGWAGSKLFVVLASMPRATDVPGRCSTDNTGNWYDAPWIGLSVGELVRAGSFVSCQCYAKDPNKGYLADGCGQFNVFEVVNDNNGSKNLDVFSTDMIDYAGYVGEGPCGPHCDVTKLAANVDLIDKPTDTEAKAGALSNPTKGPGAAFRRPVAGWRYFLTLLDVNNRTVALGMVHPGNVPAALAPLLPSLPASVDVTAIDAVRNLRLPQ